MNYDKNSFLAGLTVGRTLKGWGTAGSGSVDPGDEDWDSSNPFEVYKRMRPSDWLTMPTPEADEIWMLLHIPVGGAEFLSFKVGNSEKDADGNVLPYSVGVYTVHGGERSVVSSDEVTSGAAWEARLDAADFGNQTSDEMVQALVRVSGAGIKSFVWWYTGGNYKNSDSNVVEVAAQLPSLTSVGSISAKGSMVSYAPLIRSRTKFFALYGENSITSSYMNFSSYNSLVAVLALNVSKWTASVRFQNCRSLVAVPKLTYDGAISAASIFLNCVSIIKSPKVEGELITSTAGMFSGCSGMICADDVEYPAATSINNMYYGCAALKRLPKITAPKAKTANQVFQGCSAATYSEDVDLPAATNISNFFYGCGNLKKLPSVSAPAATNCAYLFYGCTNAGSCGGLDIPETTSAAYMFQYCSSLKSAPKLNIQKCTNIQYMLSYCFCLENISILNCPLAATVTYALTQCYSLRKIVASVKTSIDLTDCTALRSADLTYSGTAFGIGTPMHSLAKLLIKVTGADTISGTNLNLSATSIGRAAAVDLFGSLPAVSTSRTLTLTFTPAAADLTDGDIAIATAKGWTVVK